VWGWGGGGGGSPASGAGRRRRGGSRSERVAKGKMGVAGKGMIRIGRWRLISNTNIIAKKM
jgi:hypothetical protein